MSSSAGSLPRRRFRLVTPAGPVESDEPGRFAGIVTTGVFGRLSCRSGLAARRENRVFFATWEDAVATGFRPCRRCRPLPGDRYERRDGRWKLA